jgi:two-component sensor histidine kinase
MDIALDLPARIVEAAEAHLRNLAANLQLVADLSYGDVALAVPDAEGRLVVVADARPVTAVPAIASSRVGLALEPDDEPEAYESLRTNEPAESDRRRATRGMSYATVAFPVGAGSEPYAVLLRDRTQQVEEAPGKMERAFMAVADELVGVLRTESLHDAAENPFVTTRYAGDGVLRIDADRTVAYASPNAVNIMRVAGADGAVVGMGVTDLPGSAISILPVLNAGGALAAEVTSGGRVLSYRTIALDSGAVVLVQDITDVREREQEVKTKEATIREVHHRVKNNLQTVASLLRIQSRRTSSAEAAHALGEAVERISSMAVVHELLAGSSEEEVDFMDVARTVVDMVRQGLVGPVSDVQVEVSGSTGMVEASSATSLALVIAELVHNAIEHGLAGRRSGRVDVLLRRLPEELHIVVRDDGAGLPSDFEFEESANLGLAIVKSVVKDDLKGTIVFSSTRGTTVTLRVPMTGGLEETE